MHESQNPWLVKSRTKKKVKLCENCDMDLQHELRRMHILLAESIIREPKIYIHMFKEWERLVNNGCNLDICIYGFWQTCIQGTLHQLSW